MSTKIVPFDLFQNINGADSIDIETFDIEDYIFCEYGSQVVYDMCGKLNLL